MEQYRRRPMFSVVPQERHLPGSFSFETRTGIAFLYSFIISTAQRGGRAFQFSAVSACCFRAAGIKKSVDTITIDGRNKTLEGVYRVGQSSAGNRLILASSQAANSRTGDSTKASSVVTVLPIYLVLTDCPIITDVLAALFKRSCRSRPDAQERQDRNPTDSPFGDTESLPDSPRFNRGRNTALGR